MTVTFKSRPNKKRTGDNEKQSSSSFRHNKSRKEEDDSDDDNNGDVEDVSSSLRKRRNKKRKLKKSSPSLTFSSSSNKRTKGPMSFTTMEKDGEDDGEEEGSSDDERRTKKKNKKSKKNKSSSKKSKKNRGLGFGGASMMPLHYDDGIDGTENDDGSDQRGNIKKREKKSSSFVYSSFMSVQDDDEDNFSNDNHDQQETEARNMNESTTSTSAKTSMYGKEALDKLKSEQKVYVAPNQSKEDDISTTAATATDTAVPKKNVKSDGREDTLKSKILERNGISSGDNDENDGYISLTTSSSILHKTGDYSGGRNKNTIVTGEEAFSLAQEEDDDVIAELNEKSHYSSYEHNKDTSKSFFRHLDPTTPTKNDNSSSKSTMEKVLMGGSDTIGNNHNRTDDNGEDSGIDEGVRKWEKEIVRCAGVSNAGATSNMNNTPQSSSSYEDRNTRSTKYDGNTVSSKIKETIQSTLSNLNQSELDVESNLNRRKHEHEESRKEALKRETDLCDIGESFEFYQKLRLEIASWTGALRHIDLKTKDIERALEEFGSGICTTRQQERRDEEDDIIATLSENDWLNTVIGRQPDIPYSKGRQIPMVDEFGRDIVSMESLARVKKREKRRHIKLESRERRSSNDGQRGSRSEMNLMEQAKSDFQDSDGDISDNELMDMEERRFALSAAAELAFTDVDEEYTSASKLISLFQSWLKKYPEDFQQCYANLSLVDLLGVFVRAQFCKKLDLLCLMRHTDQEKQRVNIQSCSLFDELNGLDKQMLQDEKSEEADRVVNLLLEKVYRKAFLFAMNGSELKDTANSWGYNPISGRQSYAMSKFFASLRPTPKVSEELSEILLSYLRRFSNTMAIPIINQEATSQLLKKTSNQKDGVDTTEAITLATFGQMNRLKKLVFNIQKYWFPLLVGKLSVEIARFCIIDIITCRILPIMKSIDIPNGSNSICMKEIHVFFTHLADILKAAGWLDCPDLVQIIEPIRAAASSLNLSL